MAVECRASYQPGPEPSAPVDVAERALSAVRDLCGPWAATIAASLAVQPAAPIVVTVVGGAGVCRTRGTHIVLPLNDDGSGVLAGLAHELVHAVAGQSPNRLFDEGLAVQVDSELRLAGPAWPYYYLSPHRWMEVFREEGWRVTLPELIASGEGRSLAEDRSSVRRRAVHYLHAASLCRHLRDALDPDEFWARYRSGRLLPEGGDVGALEREWFLSIEHPLMADELLQRDRSFAVRTYSAARREVNGRGVQAR